MQRNFWTKAFSILVMVIFGMGLSPVRAEGDGPKGKAGVKRDRPGRAPGASGMRRPLGGPRGPRGPQSEGRIDRPPRGPREFGENERGVFFSEEDIEELMSMLSEHFPERYKELSAMRQSRPEAFRMVLTRRSSALRRLLEANRRDPKLAILILREQMTEENLKDLQHKHRQAGKSKKEEIEKRVRVLLGELFDVKLGRFALEIGHLEARLADQRRLLENRKKNKEAILTREFEKRLRPELSFD